jgi:hypothetical protein
MRHSLLPKYKQCSRYKPADGPPSAAAGRGTDLDAEIRVLLRGGKSSGKFKDDKDVAAILWGVRTIKQLTGGAKLETREEHLKNRIPHFDHTGTEDVRSDEARISCDIKSGQIYDYESQAAAYALGNMLRLQVADWTYHMVFIDQQMVVTHQFAQDSANEIVTSIIAAVNDPNAQPTACDYCRWCANRTVCPQVTQPAADTLAIVDGGLSIDAMRQQLAESPERLAKFLSAAKVFKSELWDWAKDEATRRLEAGEEVPNHKLSRVKSSVVEADGIVATAEEAFWTVREVVELMGSSVTEKNFRTFCEARGVAVKNQYIIEKPETIRLLESRKKK